VPLPAEALIGLELVAVLVGVFVETDGLVNVGGARTSCGFGVGRLRGGVGFGSTQGSDRGPQWGIGCEDPAISGGVYAVGVRAVPGSGSVPVG